MADDDFASFRKEYSPRSAEDEPEPRSSLSRVFEVLLWLAIIGTVAGIAIPTAAGHSGDGSAMLGALCGLALWTYLLGRVRRSPRAWVYPLAGAGLFVMLIFGGGVLRGLSMRSTGNDLFAAIEKFEPETGRRARAAQNDPAESKRVLLPAMSRAAQRAPDADLVAFREGMSLIVETPEGVNRKRCAEYALAGGLQSTPTREEQLLIANAMTRLFLAAASHAEPYPIDRDRAVNQRVQMLRAVDPEGVLSDPQRSAQMSPAQACDLYLGMLRFMRKMPEPEAANLMRSNMTAGS
jgi:hypothetical protein